MTVEASTRVPFMDLARQHDHLADELREAFDRVLASSAFILGEEVARFEEEFAGFCEAGECVGVGSGTAALTIMLQAAGIGPGDEVIVPGHTFIATALAVLHAGAKPVLADVRPGDGLLDPDAAQAAIGPATAAIIAVHLYGQAADMDALGSLARRHGLALFEDAAQAHGASYRGRRVGGLATASAFSFYPSKNLGALGDGGAICTSDDGLASRARELRDLGRGASPAHVVAGYNERLDGLQAALLRVKLPHVDDWTASRRAAAGRYREQLGAVAELLEESPQSPCTYHLFPIRVSDRDRVAAELRSAGVATGVHYPVALVDQPPLRESDPRAHTPVARDWAARELSLPMFAEMETAEVDFVCDSARSALERQVAVGIQPQADLT